MGRVSLYFYTTNIDTTTGFPTTHDEERLNLPIQLLGRSDMMLNDPKPARPRCVTHSNYDLTGATISKKSSYECPKGMDPAGSIAPAGKGAIIPPFSMARAPGRAPANGAPKVPANVPSMEPAAPMLMVFVDWDQSMEPVVIKSAWGSKAHRGGSSEVSSAGGDTWDAHPWGEMKEVESAGDASTGVGAAGEARCGV